MCFDHVSNQIKTIAAQVEQAMIFVIFRSMRSQFFWAFHVGYVGKCNKLYPLVN